MKKNTSVILIRTFKAFYKTVIKIDKMCALRDYDSSHTMRPKGAPQHYCSSHDYYLQSQIDILTDAVELLKHGEPVDLHKLLCIIDEIEIKSNYLKTSSKFKELKNIVSHATELFKYQL